MKLEESCKKFQNSLNCLKSAKINRVSNTCERQFFYFSFACLSSTFFFTLCDQDTNLFACGAPLFFDVSSYYARVHRGQKEKQLFQV